MHKKRLMKSITYRLFISYLVIFIIPLAILSFFLYKTAVLDVQREIESSNMHKLTQLRDSMDLRMKELEYQALMISVDSKLTPFSMTGEYYKQMEGIEKLRIYKVNNAFTEELMIYYRNYDLIFSPVGSCYPSTLTKYIYRLDEKKEIELMNDLDNIKVPMIKPSEKVNLNGQNLDLLTYMYPIGRGNSDPYAVVIFFIKKAFFQEMIKNMLGDLPGSIFVIDDKKNVLVSSNNKNFDYLKKKPDFIYDDYDEGLHRITFEGNNLAIISVKSDLTDWTFTTVIETSYLYKRASYMKTIIAEVVFGIFAFGIFVIIFMVSRNYQPIKKLLKSISLFMIREDKEKEMDEYEWINHTITSTINQNVNLKAEIDLQRPLIKGQVLTKILLEEAGDQQSLERLLKKFHINLEGPYYSVAVIKGVEGHSVYKDNIFAPLMERFHMEDTVYVVDIMQDDVIAVIMNLEDKDENRDYLKGRSRVIKEVVEAELGEECVIGIGKISDSVLQLNHSYIEAMAALNYNFMKGQDKIVFFEDIASREKQVYWYPAEDQLRFIQSLKQGNNIVAKETLNRMVEDIANNESSPTMARYICFDLINMVIKVINDIGISDLENDIERLMKFSSLMDLKVNLSYLTEKICGLLDKKKKSRDEELYKEITDYINANYDKYDLSLEGIGDKFQLPSYYLSRFFKEHSDFTFTDFVTKLRMDRAKILLSNTDIPIKDIVAKIGYTDLTNFMRRFKQIEGITPGQYRKLYLREKKNVSVLSEEGEFMERM